MDGVLLSVIEEGLLQAVESLCVPPGMNEGLGEPLASAPIERALGAYAAAKEHAGLAKLVHGVLGPPHQVVTAADRIVELGEGHVVVGVVPLPVLQRFLQHWQGLLVLPKVLLGNSHVPEVVLLRLLVAGHLLGRLEILLGLLVLPEHVVHRPQVVEGGGVRRSALGHLLQQHRSLLLPGLLAPQRCAILEPFHVPRQPALHAVRLYSPVEGVGLVDGVVLEVGHCKIQGTLKHFRVAEAVLRISDSPCILRFEALEDPQVLLRARHEVVLRPHEVRLLDGRLRWRPANLVGAAAGRHHRAQDHREGLKLVHVAVEHALDQTGAGRLDRVLVDVRAPDEGPGKLRVHRRKLDGAGPQLVPQRGPRPLQSQAEEARNADTPAAPNTSCQRQ
mmetsp:Transcript_89582/g.248767  ORF Transcript_89582/g.248767 Transcript_89582/m.248767 type:complete len:390 (-) Transcript_89582:153-1322(-)